MGILSLNITQGQKVNWTDELIATFEEIKAYCAQPIKLYFLDRTRPVYVNTDASLKGWGGILYQLKDDGTKAICGINLTFLKESPSRKVQRWRLVLQHFTFETIHVAGEINVEADTLSRILSFDKSSD